MKEQILKILTAGAFAIAGFLGYNQLTDVTEIGLWNGLILAVAGVGGYYIARILEKTPAPNG